MNSKEPGTYYYRRVENIHYGEIRGDRPTAWGPWEPITVQIPVRNVSPIVHRGRLYVFWVERQTRPLEDLDNGESELYAYYHQFTVRYVTRNMDGTWTPAQEISLGDVTPFSYLGSGTIEDYRYPANYPLEWANRVFYDSENYHYSTPREGYTVEGWNWTSLYPSVFFGDLTLRGVDFRMWSRVDFRQGQAPTPALAQQQRRTPLCPSFLGFALHLLLGLGLPQLPGHDNHRILRQKAVLRESNAETKHAR